jgi:hypothetical protein
VKTLNCKKYIEKVMWEYPEYHYANIQPHLRTIFIELYSDSGRYHYTYNKCVHNKVCIKCGECFLMIEREKYRIELAVKKYTEKYRKEKLRKKLAQDIYMLKISTWQNCTSNIKRRIVNEKFK